MWNASDDWRWYWSSRLSAKTDVVADEWKKAYPFSVPWMIENRIWIKEQRFGRASKQVKGFLRSSLIISVRFQRFVIFQLHEIALYAKHCYIILHLTDAAQRNVNHHSFYGVLNKRYSLTVFRVCQRAVTCRVERGKGRENAPSWMETCHGNMRRHRSDHITWHCAFRLCKLTIDEWIERRNNAINSATVWCMCYHGYDCHFNVIHKFVTFVFISRSSLWHLLNSITKAEWKNNNNSNSDDDDE